MSPTKATSDFDRAFRAIKVVCVGGYSTATAPSQLIHAICVWASQLQRFKTSQGKENISQRGGSVTLSPKTMPGEVKELIYTFRNSGVAL
jgi:hypothetical protein